MKCKDIVSRAVINLAASQLRTSIYEEYVDKVKPNFSEFFLKVQQKVYTYIYIYRKNMCSLPTLCTVQLFTYLKYFLSKSILEDKTTVFHTFCQAAFVYNLLKHPQNSPKSSFLAKYQPDSYSLTFATQIFLLSIFR